MPWLVFVNRMNGTERFYGESDSFEEGETMAAHLRRGEFISSISGCRSWSGACSSGTQQPLAQCLRIVTSEAQEIVVGESAADFDFCFQAHPGHEIIGLILTQDGVISDVKQAVLAPSRVQASTAAPNAAPVAIAAGAGGVQPASTLEPTALLSQTDPCSSPTRKQKVESRQKSLGVLSQMRARRIMEAVE